jgi:hypothetical protein
MALDTVADYVALARTLLMDEVDSPYRYPDAQLVLALNLSLMETKKVRPDLMLDKTLPNFTVVDTTAVDMDEMYRVPLVYYMCGHAQMRDEEGNQDARAAGFLGLFRSQMGGI